MFETVKLRADSLRRGWDLMHGQQIQTITGVRRVGKKVVVRLGRLGAEIEMDPFHEVTVMREKQK